jgi:hypothetical protein
LIGRIQLNFAASRSARKPAGFRILRIPGESPKTRGFSARPGGPRLRFAQKAAAILHSGREKLARTARLVFQLRGETMVAVVYDDLRTSGWLRNRQFDLTFIAGLTILALGCGAAVTLDHRLFLPILLADLWFLGYHHVIATFTRLSFDAHSRRRYRFLLFGLPVLIAAACVGIVTASGLWALVTVYFYWQWFHYTRQSWGVARAYRRKAASPLPETDTLDLAMFYALPVAGIVARSAQQPETFLSLPVRMIPMPQEIAMAFILAAAALVAVWAVKTAAQYARGQLPLGYVLYMVSHHVIFAMAYLAIRDVTVGWLVVNVWHNAQYVLFVWMFNNRRFAAGVSPKARLLSWLSQDGRIGWYLGFCVLVSTGVYWTVGNVLPLFLALPIFVVYQVFNFHHYVVDAVIWRRAQVKDALEHA